MYPNLKGAKISRDERSGIVLLALVAEFCLCVVIVNQF